MVNGGIECDQRQFLLAFTARSKRWRVGTEGHIAQNVVEFYRTRFSIRPVVEPYAVLQQEIYLRTIRGEGELTAFGGCHLFAGGRLLAQEYAFQFRACLVDEIRRQHYSFVC